MVWRDDSEIGGNAKDVIVGGEKRQLEEIVVGSKSMEGSDEEVMNVNEGIITCRL